MRLFISFFWLLFLFAFLGCQETPAPVPPEAPTPPPKSLDTPAQVPEKSDTKSNPDREKEKVSETKIKTKAVSDSEEENQPKYTPVKRKPNTIPIKLKTGDSTTAEESEGSDVRFQISAPEAE